jgi:hypothetical protein
MFLGSSMYPAFYGADGLRIWQARLAYVRALFAGAKPVVIGLCIRVYGLAHQEDTIKKNIYEKKIFFDRGIICFSGVMQIG